jgi:GH15 family glucan-1,4-alpha-glucosidase
VGFALAHRATEQPPPGPWSQREIEQRLGDTAEAWRTWSSLHQGYEGPWRELVQRSGLVLQGLTYFHTGAICAAATTSLPEEEGGSRNWDYRFTWVRDACLTLDALWIAACPDEAHKYFDFLTGSALTHIRKGADLQIMFGIGGEHDLTERELHHLSGWRNSGPVRIGNGAWAQRQLDVYGELLSAVARLREQLRHLDPTTRHFFVEVADAAARRWTEKGQGIWEVRGPPRDFVHSKLMCWVALDRAIKLADILDAGSRVDHWRQTREAIRTAILARGWSDKAQAFTQAFGVDDLDASNLMIPIVGFLPGDDPRVVATVDAIASRLTDEHGLVYRYRAGDGFEGEEGSFLLCTFWLAQAQALAGQVERATATFSRAAAYANDVGLLAEEVDPRSRELLGNFPQAFSHVGLINAAWTISEALERRRAPDTESKPLSPIEAR